MTSPKFSITFGFLVRFFLWITVGLATLFVLNAIWIDRPHQPSRPLTAVDLQQQTACALVKSTKQTLLVKGFIKQAERLDEISVCDPQRPYRHRIYWLFGIGAIILGLPLAVLLAMNPKA